MNNQISNYLRPAINQQSQVSSGRYQDAGNQSGYKFNYSGGRNWFQLDHKNILNIIQSLLAQLVDRACNDRGRNEYRSIDGSGNNRRHPEWGSAKQPVNQLLTPDATREPGGAAEVSLPSPRAVSNVVSDQQGNTENHKGLSDLFWLWGQFLDHDITIIEGHGANGSADIAVPAGDPYFDPAGTGTATIGFTRSDTITDASGQKRLVNDITAFIDGSNVYGSDQETADNLRSFQGGRMKVDAANLLPKSDDGQYQAGDIRANENVGLTSMHTLWVREHNRIADELSAKHPKWGDERIYQEARQQVVAELQAITYNEFLPNLLGEDALSEYQGYNPNQNPQMNAAFSSAAYRFGHSMLSPTLLRLDENGNEIAQGNLSLRDAFFQPEKVAEAGIDPILRGAASQTAQAVDTQVVDDVRNFLFGPPGSGGLDLVSLNIQRGRDHALPGYNDAREELGLSRIESFDDPIWQDGVGEKLAQVYDSPDDVDLWVAGLAENHVGDSLMGETATRILTIQFEALRDGDRFWYENQYSGRELRKLNDLSLSDIIKRNTDVENVQDNVMVASNVHRTATDAPVSKMMAPAMQDMRMQAAPPAAGAEADALEADVIRILEDAAQQGLLG
jgi:GH24 family phage-related lysozyme (muramidase)